MALKVVLTRGKLQRTERRARKLHGLQRRYRRLIDELETEKKKGLDKAKYEARKAKLEAKRHAIISELHSVEEQERALRAELKALEAAA